MIYDSPSYFLEEKKIDAGPLQLTV